MRRVLLLALIGILKIGWSSAQCTFFDVDVPATVCRESNFSIANRTSAMAFEWDLCPSDLQMTPSVANVTNIDLSSVLDVALVEDNGQFYGFVTDANTNSVARLNFGNSRDNIPTKEDLGNINSLFQFPNSIEIFLDNGTWLGIVANAGNEKVV